MPKKVGSYFSGYQLRTFNLMSLVGVPRVWVVHFGYIFKALRFILTFGPLLIAYTAVLYVACTIMYFASNPRMWARAGWSAAEAPPNYFAFVFDEMYAEAKDQFAARFR